jgi:cell division protein FtsQ
MPRLKRAAEPLRRNPARFAFATRFVGPRTLGALALLAVAGGAYWAHASGTIAQLAARSESALLAASAAAGLTVREVYVVNRAVAAPAQLAEALGVKLGDPLLAAEPAAIAARLEALPAVRSARVERRFPGTLVVALEERKPFALWQSGQRMQVIDRDGVVIAREAIERHAKLPLVVGADANLRAVEILSALESAPAVARHVTAARLVNARRWDLVLDGGIIVRLPANNVDESLNRLSALINEHDVLKKDVVALDFRVRGKLTVQTTKETAKRLRTPNRTT